MYTESGKKSSILHILTILKKYTDADHTMTQQQILDKLKTDYGLVVDRTTVKRNIEDLIDAGYSIEPSFYTRKQYNKKTGEIEENTIYTNLYYIHDFDESELHMLIDGLLFSRSVPNKARKDLINKLVDLSSSHFDQRMKHVHSMTSDGPQNPDLFYNIEVLDKAIAEGKQVEITYGNYGTDMKLHPRLDSEGNVKKQLLNPYQLVASEGRYYLICNKDNYNNVANYRIDRIMDIKMLETLAKPKSQVEGLEDGLKLQKYVYQNVNMFAGKPEKVEFIVPESAVGLVIDFFGKHVSFFPMGDGKYSCHMDVSRAAMRHWAAQFAGTVKVVSPPELVEEIRAEIRKYAEMYDMKAE